MSETGRETRAGPDGPGAASPAEAVKTALAGFVEDLGAFQAEMKSKFQKQEERLMMLDRKSLAPGRARPLRRRQRPRRRTRRRSPPTCATATTTACGGWSWKARRCPPRWPATAATWSIRRPRSGS